ncbi:ribose 5-phosphate isomerase B [Chitinophaga sedimenti]|uniref:ribose 5-phosphate isomerase B n=1 Tax=Chitinophaga sedimenti TaxID=2033606 RepID=UPI0020041273|nr:ribose 5-phosphate isomerase B [Chitinophaga sedimenti]MCK7558225.1 ribose 5-phosphate isomerase B [Chitinophaga sedimenti]
MEQNTFDLALPVAIGSDHAGYEYKEEIISYLEGKGIQIKDFGTNSPDSVDYPDYAHPLSVAVENGEVAFGIPVCGSGNGVAITANKHRGVRAAICWGEELARLARGHNNANVLSVPARFVSTDVAKQMVETFMATPFEGGRHANRVNKIACA